MNESTRIALDIFKKVLSNEKINDIKNPDLYSEYRLNDGVQSDVNEILEIFNLELYEYQNEGLFVTPGVDNQLFGYSNKELRKELKVENNSELSICYFIMYCILSKFYRESSHISAVDFITAIQILNDAEGKIKIIEEKLKEIEELSDDDESYVKLVDYWRSKDDFNVKSKAQNIENDSTSKYHIAYVNRVLNFFCDQNLLHKNEIQDTYTVQSKMAAIVGYYYEEYTARGAITQYLEECLGENKYEE